jgi:hypothetical protein
MRSKQESSFCEQKEAKKLYPLAPSSMIEAVPHQRGKSLFASFSSEKEGLPSFGAPA